MAAGATGGGSGGGGASNAGAGAGVGPASDVPEPPDCPPQAAKPRETISAASALTRRESGCRFMRGLFGNAGDAVTQAHPWCS